MEGKEAGAGGRKGEATGKLSKVATPQCVFKFKLAETKYNLKFISPAILASF